MTGVAAARARIPATFTDAFPTLYATAYRTAFKLLGDRLDAEDIAQEACARACIRWRRLDDPVAWVARVSTNLSFDRWRRLRTVAKHPIDPAAPQPAHDGRRIDLHRALELLPARQRDVVALRYLADLSEAQVAQVLGCALGTVKSHASRGLAALRAELGEDF
jgi:RNA polymerase sigma-70 factor (sigma-E family)